MAAPLPIAPTPTQLALVPTLTPVLPSPTHLQPPTPLSTPFTPSPIPAGRAWRPSEIGRTTTPITPTRSLDPSAPPTPLGTIERRPPPMSVPLALHPADHYWLQRPLPSDTRNYALEWYPYGNDVLIPAYAPYRIHHGLDFPNVDGTQVLAAGSGTVIWAGPRPSDRDGVDYYGNTIIIQHDWQWHGQNVYTLYAHTLEMFVQVGNYVEAGQLLAGVGGTGYTTGPHLHFEVRVGSNQYFATRNPHLWLAPYEGWGTLAGRFIDRRGNFISSADLLVTPLDTENTTFVRRQRTYEDLRLRPDEVWNENFVVGDLPMGTYLVELALRTAEDGLERRYTRTVEVLPGRTNFIVVQADFIFVPTPTPIITSTVELTTTLTVTSTIGSDDASP